MTSIPPKHLPDAHNTHKEILPEPLKQRTLKNNTKHNLVMKIPKDALLFLIYIVHVLLKEQCLVNCLTLNATCKPNILAAKLSAVETCKIGMH